MLPISVDLAQTRVMLVGEGAAACRRLKLLDEAGAASLDIFAPEPDPELAESGWTTIAQAPTIAGRDRRGAAGVCCRDG